MTGTPALEVFERVLEEQETLRALLSSVFSERIAASRRRLKPGQQRLYAPTLRKLAQPNAALRTATDWAAVMVVTAVETYLIDALSFCAAADPSLMKDSVQQASYADVLNASSVERLAYELRRRWARKFTEDGGPARWVARLTRMGANGYGPAVGTRLEALWGFRHVMVHNAGRATDDYLTRHGTDQIKAGERLTMKPDDLKRYVDDSRHFATITDRFLHARALAKRASDTGGAT